MSINGLLDGKQSPWGTIDASGEIAPGILWCATPSHGGIKVDRSHNARIPREFREDGGWYEEDCAWCKPFIFFEEEIKKNTGDEGSMKAIARQEHIMTAQAWFPEVFAHWKKFGPF